MPQNSSILSIYSLGENYMLFQLIYMVAKLGLADLTWNTPRTAEELAIQVNVNPDALCRVLKPLTQLGIFEQHGRDKYQLVSSYEALLSHHPDSLYHYVIVSGDIYYKAFSELLSCVQTGTTGFEQAFGKKFFTYLSEHPDIFNHFNMHMSMRVRPLAEVLLATYNFLAYRHIVDIGGGNGQFLSLLLQKYPHLQATLFDLPATCEQAEVTFRQANLSERCTTYSGDFFFDSLPEGGDLYMLSHILHDWDDEHALRILQNCARTMASNSKIIIVEHILHEYQPTANASIMDLFMLVVIGGRERTARQFRELLARAGFQITSIIPIPGYPSVIEAIPFSASLS